MKKLFAAPLLLLAALINPAVTYAHPPTPRCPPNPSLQKTELVSFRPPTPRCPPNPSLRKAVPAKVLYQFLI